MSRPPLIDARFNISRSGFAMQLALELPGRGVTALFGHSGSGKTTLLRAIAGLERHAGAYLSVNGEVWQDAARDLFVPAFRRPLGYVFQEASLFPHLSVKGNLDYARRRADSRHGAIDMAHAVALLGIGDLLDRPTTDLSGGERQRIAIARALLSNPRLLLLDEPLASLDWKRKNEVLPYLERVREELDIPMLYVSHSPSEVARLADHVVVLDAGSVIASGSVAETLSRLDLPVELADDPGTVIEGIVDGFDEAYQLLRLKVGSSMIQVAHKAMPPGASLQLRILARDVSLTLTRQTGTSVLNQLPATVVAGWQANETAHAMISLDWGGVSLLARITRRSRDELGIEPGKQVWAQIKSAALLLTH